MSIRESFVARFGEDQAETLFNAALHHQNMLGNQNKGSDPFKWAVLICIGFECVSVRNYAKYHGITISQEDFKDWILTEADLKTHDGDFDTLAAVTGAYEPYIESGP